MLTLPAAILPIAQPFAALFHCRTWRKVQVLLVGAILSTGSRTVASALRITGRSGDAGFARFHHVLNRNNWRPLPLAELLLRLALRYLYHGGALVFGLDESLERRWGKRIKARGIYRDSARSSHSHLVKTSGLRWVSVMWLTFVPWAQRIWALPILTALAPSERYDEQRGKPHKTLADWARQLILQLRRWLPEHPLVLVADSSYAVLDLLHFCQSLPQPVTFITRLRLDAALYAPAPPRKPGQAGRPALKGKRLPSLQEVLRSPQTEWTPVMAAWYDGTTRALELASGTAVWYHRGKPPVPLRWVLIRDPLAHFQPQALLCTDAAVSAPQIVEWFVLRWQLEVTFQEVRKHLGVETQRQWSDRAISRTTPALLGLFTWTTLAAHLLQGDHPFAPRQSAWYAKPLPTFADALALVRQDLWLSSEILSLSHGEPETAKIPMPLFKHLLDTVAYAA